MPGCHIQHSSLLSTGSLRDSQPQTTPCQPHQSSCAGRENSTCEDTEAFLLYNKQLTFAECSPYLEPVVSNLPVLQNPWGALKISPCLSLTTKISTVCGKAWAKGFF